MPQTFSSAVTAFAADPASASPVWVEKLNPEIMAASSEDIANQLPLLINLSESSSPDTRIIALLLLEALIARPTQNRRSIDTSTAELLFPYMDKIAPRLADTYPEVRAVSRSIFSLEAMLHPSSLVILHLTLDLLRNPQSTTEPLNQAGRGNPGYGWAYGPELLTIILVAGATSVPNAADEVSKWRDSPDVQAAMIEFVHRRSLTPAARAGTIKALAESQVQNPAVNAALLPWLTSSDAFTQMELLTHLNQLTLSLQDDTRVRALVRNLADDPQTSATLHSAASTLLSCWKNDVHRGPCPPSR